MAEVSQIFVYPIKSCRGIAVEHAEVEARGLASDRRYMLVDANGRFLTQRRYPQMALIDVAFGDQAYAVSAPGCEPLSIPLALSAESSGQGGVCEVKIWNERVQATLAGSDTNLWFSDYMGFACGLVYMADDQHRPVHRDAARFDDEVSFADGAPLLLVSEPSLEDLNARLARPVGMRRFRPNIVVSADEPFEEDGWNHVTVGSAAFDVGWACSRCILPTVDPETGQRDADGEPMRTLKTYRQRGSAVYFGQNLLPRVLGRIELGARIGV